MPFKIVQTIEDSKLCLCVVPSGWEEKGILYWPNKNKLGLNKMLRDEKSLPVKDKWDKIMCVKKRELPSFEKAQYEMDKMECETDTEQEKESLSKRKRADCKSFMPLDLNYLTELPSKSIETQQQGLVEEIIPDDEQTNVIWNYADHDPQIIIENEEIQSQTEVHTTEHQQLITYAVPVDHTKILTEIVKNQNTMIQKQAKLETSLDSLIKLLDQYITTNSSEIKETTNKKEQFKLLSPINSLQQLEEFNGHLNDQHKLNNVVDQMSQICGKSGKENGLDVSYKLIDYFLDRNFVSLCSWTGSSRDGKAKFAIKHYKNFKKCILQTIMLADNQFSEQQLDVFLKRILKNSSQRKVAKRIMSTHKKRPKTLTYRPKITETFVNSDHENHSEEGSVLSDVETEEISE